MTKEELENLSVTELKIYAKKKEIKLFTVKKELMISHILEVEYVRTHHGDAFRDRQGNKRK